MIPCKAQLALIALVAILGTTQMLASCGQKGDLYLPNDAPREERR
jgi:predicted small lipoprotein YifL